MKQWFLFLLLFCAVTAMAQEERSQNAASLFSGARLTRQPVSYSTSSSTGLVRNYSSEALIDGSQQKIWCSAQNKRGPFVFELELVETFVISELEFSNIVEAYAGIGAREVVVELAATKKAPSYTTVLRTSLKENDQSRFKIDPQEARLIRLTILSNYGHPQYTELAEFKAIGTPKVQDLQLIRIDGGWNSNWGGLTFRQNGTLVEGNYVFNRGVIRYGGIQRNKVTYTWIEDVIKRKGNTVMFMNEEGDELIGIWCYDNDWSQYGFWILNRKKGIPFEPQVNEEPLPEAVPSELVNIKPEASIVQQMEQELKVQKKMVVYGINFKFNSAELLAESYTVLRQIFEVLQKNTGMKIRIEGHTDDRGSDEYNRKLSLQRAEAVRQFFIRSGIEANRLQAEGKGELQPVADNESELGRSLNRRVEMHLVD